MRGYEIIFFSSLGRYFYVDLIEGHFSLFYQTWIILVEIKWPKGLFYIIFHNMTDVTI